MLSFGAFGIAALPLGVLADAIGLRVTFGAMALGVLAVVGVFAVTGRRRLAAADAAAVTRLTLVGILRKSTLRHSYFYRNNSRQCSWPARGAPFPWRRSVPSGGRGSGPPPPTAITWRTA